MKREKQICAPCSMSYFGTVRSLLQSVDSHVFCGDLTVGLPSAVGSGASMRAQGRGALSALCRLHQCVGVENDSEA